MKRYTLSIIAVLFMAFALSAQAAGIKTWHAVNVRAGPSTTNAIIGTVGITSLTAICQQQGENVNAEGKFNPWWTKINFGSGSGWITNIYIVGDQQIAGVPHCSGGSTPKPQPKPQTGVRTWHAVNVRAGPSTTNAIVGTVGISTVSAICQQQGEMVNAEGQANNWWTKIHYGSGSGWITNIYIVGGQKVAGVPVCSGGPAPKPQPSGSGPCGVASNRQGIVAAAMWAVNSKQYISYSQSPSRWSGISQGVCPYNRLPPVADCSSFVSWLYWSAFGKGGDFLNGQNWSAGYTGTMGNHGVAVSLANARPGDVVLYGQYPYEHATLYVGNNQVVSYGQNGPVYLIPINYRGDFSIRSYLA